MRTAIRRLSLGFVLIALSSGVLLISDWGQRKGSGVRIPRVAVVQHASQALLDEGVSGMLDALAADGFVDGKNIHIQRFTAENDLPTAAYVHSRIVSLRAGGPASAETVLNTELPYWEQAPAAAYSTTSKEFLVAWARYGNS